MKETMTNGKKLLTIPNILSLFRLCLIPMIVYAYNAAQSPEAAVMLLLLSGLTDIADGIIARKCNMVTDLGKALDPVADKLTQFAMLYCLLKHFPLMLIPFVVLIVKELTAAVISLLTIRKTKKVMGAVWHGKLTTVLLYAMMMIHLLWFRIPAAVSNILIAACTAMMLVSAVLYAVRNINALKNGE